MTVNDALIIALIVITVVIAVNLPKTTNIIKMMLQNQQIDHQNIMEISERLKRIEQQLKERVNEENSANETHKS